MTRYRTRVFMAASAIGLLIGASAGAAYLGGRLARDVSASGKAARLMQMAELNNGDMTTSAALGAEPLNATALSIATRFSPYGSDASDQSPQVDQTLTALRTSSDVRSQKGLLVRASLTTNTLAANMPATDTTPLRTTPLYADHPVRPASAMVFKAHSQTDSDCLTQAVYYEARGEGVDGMRAVAQVILNRVRHPAFPKTICGVVYQGAYRGVSCQFSFVCNGAMAGPVEAWAWRRAKDVAAAALEGYVMKSVGTATHFHTLSVDPVWSGNMVRIATVGSHVFYQFRGRGSRIGDTDGVSPSGDVPVVIQASATIPASDASALNSAQPTINPETVAAADAKTILASSVQRADTPAKPVTLSAKVTGAPADAIAAALTPSTPAVPQAKPAQ